MVPSYIVTTATNNTAGVLDAELSKQDVSAKVNVQSINRLPGAAIKLSYLNINTTKF